MYSSSKKGLGASRPGITLVPTPKIEDEKGPTTSTKLPSSVIASSQIPPSGTDAAPAELTSWTLADQKRQRAFERMEKLSADLNNYLKTKKAPQIFQGQLSNRSVPAGSAMKPSQNPTSAAKARADNKDAAGQPRHSARRVSPGRIEDENSQSRAFSDSKRKSANMTEIQKDLEEVSKQINIYQPKLIKNCIMKEHQIWGLNWLIDLHTLHSNGILADQMGLGKTLQTISFMAYLKEVENVSGPHLVVCPLTVTVNWFRELEKYYPSCKALIVPAVEELRDEAVTKMRSGKYDVIIASYESLATNLRAFRKTNFVMFVIDEAHRLKNDESQFFSHAMLVNAKRKLLLTGTPLSNQIKELFSLLNFIMPSIFSDKDSFETLFGSENIPTAESSSGRSKIQEQLIQKLHKIIEPFMLRRLKQDTTLGLPEKKELCVYCPLSTMQGVLYKNIFTKSHKELGLSRTKNIVMDMRKAAIHPYLFPETDTEPQEIGEHIVKNSGKFVVLDKLIKKLVIENREKVLIFSQFKIALDILEDYMALRELGMFRLDGATLIDDRNKYMDEFNSPQTDKLIFLLSTRAGGLGINLVAARYVIFLDSDWNPQMDMQAMDRVHRIGQKRPVTVFRLITKNTIEERILEAQNIKIKLDYLVVERGRQTNRAAGGEFSLDKLSEKEIQDLAHFGASNILNMQNEDLDKLDIDKILKDAEEAHEKNKKFQQDKLKEYTEKATDFEKVLDLKTLSGADDAQLDEQRRKDADAIRQAILEAIQEKRKGKPEEGPGQGARDRILNAKKSRKFFPKAYNPPAHLLLGPELEGKISVLDLKRQKYDFHLENDRLEELQPGEEWKQEDEAQINQLQNHAITMFDKLEFEKFVRGVKNCGRHRLSAIQRIYLPEKTLDQLYQYSEVFWSIGVPRCPNLLADVILAESELFAGELSDRVLVELFGYQKTKDEIYIPPELMKKIGSKLRGECCPYEFHAWLLFHYVKICKKELDRTEDLGDWLVTKKARSDELHALARNEPEIKKTVSFYSPDVKGYFYQKYPTVISSIYAFYEIDIPKCKSTAEIESTWFGSYKFTQEHKRYKNALLNFRARKVTEEIASKRSNFTPKSGAMSRRMDSIRASSHTMTELISLIKMQIACKGDVFTTMSTAEAITQGMLERSGLDMICQEKEIKLKVKKPTKRRSPSQGAKSNASAADSATDLSIGFFDTISAFDVEELAVGNADSQVEDNSLAVASKQIDIENQAEVKQERVKRPYNRKSDSNSIISEPRKHRQGEKSEPAGRNLDSWLSSAERNRKGTLDIEQNAQSNPVMGRQMDIENPQLPNTMGKKKAGRSGQNSDVDDRPEILDQPLITTKAVKKNPDLPKRKLKRTSADSQTN